MKKFLITLVIIFVVIVLGYLGWRWYTNSKKSPLTDPGDAGSSAAGTITPVNQNDVRTENLSNAPVLGYWLNGNDVFYVAENGVIYKNKAPVTNQGINDVNYVKPSPSGTRAIIVFAYPFEPTLTIFDASKGVWDPALPDGVTAAAWHPTSDDRLVYLRSEGPRSVLYSLTFSGETKKVEQLAVLSIQDIELDWVKTSPDIIYITDRASADSFGFLWAYNTKEKSLKPITKETRGLILRWLGNNLGLKFSDNRLDIVDMNAVLVASVGISTIPSKCAADSAGFTLYCAAPAANAEIKMPDDYLQGGVEFRDNLFGFSLSDAQGGLLKGFLAADPGDFPGDFDLDHLTVQNGKIFFINRFDHNLYSFKL